MSDSISLVDYLLTRSRLMARMGRRSDTRHLLNRLLAHSELSNETRAEGLRLLASIELEVGRFRRARRHLFAAIGLCPKSDELYVEYARAIEADPEGDAKKAVKALRRAVSINPLDVRALTLLGRLALRAGDRRVAWKALRRAAELRPVATEVLAEIVDGFTALGLDREARQVLVAARFRTSDDAAVQALVARSLYNQAAREQQSDRLDDERCVLPFPRPADQVDLKEASPTILRADRKSRSVPHVLRMFGMKIDPRQAR